MIYTHCLGFNLPNEVEESTMLLYRLNPDIEFKHVIVDLGFPLEYGADVPQDIEKAKDRNSAKLFRIASKFGSDYFKAENIGVSQNWNQVIAHIGLKDEDILICADPDERPQTKGWVKAIADVLQADKRIAACALVMPEQKQILDANPAAYDRVTIANHHVYKMKNLVAMAQVGFSGHFLNKAGGVPVPKGWGVYGHLESALNEKFRSLGYGWCILRDYSVVHTECSTLYREYKTDVTSGKHVGEGQIHFDTWLKLKQ